MFSQFHGRLRKNEAGIPRAARYADAHALEHEQPPGYCAQILKPGMSESAFDTLGASRRLKAAGIEAEQADAIVEVMGQSANRLVTVEHFDAGLAMLGARIEKGEARTDSVHSDLQARIDSVHAELQARINAVHAELQARIDSVHAELQARIDSVRNDMRAEYARSQLISVGIIIAANALTMAILGILLTGRTPM